MLHALALKFSQNFLIVLPLLPYFLFSFSVPPSSEPQIQQGVWRSTARFPAGSEQSGAPAEIKFDAF